LLFVVIINAFFDLFAVKFENMKTYFQPYIFKNKYYKYGP